LAGPANAAVQPKYNRLGEGTITVAEMPHVAEVMLDRGERSG
jgi:hypothetical protein